MANTVKIELNVDSAGAVSGTRQIDAALKNTSAATKQLGVDMEATGAKTAAATTKMGSAANSVADFMARANAATAAYNAQAARGTEVAKRLGLAFDAAMVGGKTFVEAQEAATAAVAEYIPVAEAATKATRSMGASFGTASVISGALTGSVNSMGYGLAYAGVQSKLLGPLLEKAMPLMLGVAFVGMLAELGKKLYDFVQEAERAPEAIRNAWAKLNTAADTTSDSLAVVNDKLEEQIAKLEGAPENHLKTQLDEAKLAADKLATSLQTAAAQMDALLKTNHIGGLSGFFSNQAVTGTAEGSIRSFNQKIADLSIQKQTAMNRGNTKAAAAIDKQIRDTQNSALSWARKRLDSEKRLQKWHDHDFGLTPSFTGEMSDITGFTHRIENEQSLAEQTARNLADRTKLGHLQDQQKPKPKRVVRDRTAMGERERDRMVAGLERAYTQYERIQEREQAAAERKYAAILRGEKRVTNEVDNLENASVDSRLKGFARIEAMRKAQLASFKKDVEAAYGNAPAADQAEGRAMLGRGNDAINEQAAKARSDLSRRNAEETASIEERANARSMVAMHNQTAAIDAEYKSRTQKYQEEKDRQEISEEDYNRRVVAAGKMRDAELIEASERAHDRMARTFTRFFRGMNNPMQELARLGENVAGDEAATLWQKLGGTDNGGHGRDNLLGTLGSVFHRNHASADAKAERAGEHPSAATSSVFSVSTAIIHVGSGSIAFGGTGSGRAPLNPAAGLNGSPAMLGGAGMGSSIASQPQSITESQMQGGTVGGVNLPFQTAQELKSGYDQITDSFGKKIPVPKGLTGFLAKNGSTIAGGAESGLGLFSAFESNGGVGGALGGALSGAKLGMMIGGPIGGAIGAAAGGIMGAFGFGGRGKAHDYDVKQVRPRIAGDTESYEQGGMTYLAAYSDMQSLMNEAKHTTAKMGSGASHYYQDTIKKEIETAEQRFTRMERAGRSRFGVSAASYAVGTDYVPSTGMALIHEGERIVPASDNRQIARALYRTAVQSDGQRQMRMSGGETHIHLNAIDARSSHRWLMENKNALRSAVNASYAENSGGSDF